MASHIERRKFLATLGGAAVAWPLGARAQLPAMPVIGSLYGVQPRNGRASWPDSAVVLSETGFVEGRNDRWADGDLIGPEQIGLLFYPRMLYFAQRRSGLMPVLRAEE